MAEEKKTQPQEKKTSNSTFDEIRSTVKAIQTGDFRTSSQKRAIERSENRRKKAERREKSRLERIQNVPTEIEAKDTALLDKQVKHAPVYWKYNVVLGNRFVRDAVMEAMTRLDDVFNFLNYNVPALIKNKAKIRAIQVQLGSRLKDLKDLKNKHQDSVYALYKQYGLNLQQLINDENLKRVTPPMQVHFTISSPHSIEFLRVCGDIDNILTMEEYLVMFGFMQEGVQIRDSRAMQNAIRNYSRVINETYTSFTHKLEEVGLRKTRAQKRDEAKEKESNVKADKNTSTKKVEDQKK